MISGSNYVYYETVAAYSVSPQNARVFSGGGSAQFVSQGTTFHWYYDPDNPSTAGFTGAGWLDNVSGSPLNVAGKKGSDIEKELVDRTRVNLDDIFEGWQIYVREQANDGNDKVVGSFIDAIYKNGGSSSCYTIV